MVQGQGTTESLKVAGKPPGPGSSLRFKITEALLKDCSESEYFLGCSAEQKRTCILYVQLEMCGNTFPVLVPQKFKSSEYSKIGSLGIKISILAFLFNLKVKKEETKALHPLKSNERR